MPHRSVCRWVVKFKGRHQDLKDAARSGPNIKKITDLFNHDARMRSSANFSLARVRGILKKHLKLRKINAR